MLYELTLLTMNLLMTFFLGILTKNNGFLAYISQVCSRVYTLRPTLNITNLASVFTPTLTISDFFSFASSAG